MTAVHRYVDPNGAWSEDLGDAVVRLGEIPGFTIGTEVGDVGFADLTLDDPSGTVGHSSDAITGHKFYFLDENAATAGNRRVFAGLILDREYGRSTETTGSMRLSSAREIKVNLAHINAVLGLQRFSSSTAKRPVESVSDRITWLMARPAFTDFVSTATTYVASSSRSMDAVDYRPASTPLDVISDCCVETGWTAFLIWSDETAAKPLLWFDDLNTATTYLSTRRLSNVLADVDSGTEIGVGGTGTFSFANAVLRRSPLRVGSTFIVPFRKGYESATRTATATSFIARDLMAPLATVKTRARAARLADRLLQENKTEEDVLTGSVMVPAANVNDIREGHRISVKVSHAPGYSGFNNWRVIKRVVKQAVQSDQLYQLDLTLSPSAAAVVCNIATATDRALGGTATGFTETPLAAPTNVANVNDGNDLTGSSMSAALIDPVYTGSTLYRGWQIDLGSSYNIGFFDVRKRQSDTWPDRIQYSSDGSAWTTLTGATIAGLVDGLTGIYRWTFASALNFRYWRVGFTVYCGGGLPYGFSFDGAHIVDDLRIWECT